MTNINWEKLDKKKLLELLEKGNSLLNEWTDAVITMGAELFIICPQHEVFKTNYFTNNTKMMMIRRSLELINLCKYDRIIYQKDGNRDYIHNLKNMQKILEDKAKNLERDAISKLQ